MTRMLPLPVKGCPKPKYFIAAPTHSQVKRIYWDDMKAMIPKEWLLEDPTESVPQHIRTIFGSELFLIGLDVPARIEGTQWAGGIVDESSDVKPGAWSKSIRPALSGYHGWGWRMGVPKRHGVGAAEFRLAHERAKSDELEDSDAFWWRSEDILTPEEIRAAKIELSEEDYEEQYGAKWLDKFGILFSAFSTTQSVRPCTYFREKPIYVSCDFNVDPMSWILAHKHGHTIEVFDELSLRNTNTQKTLDALTARYPKHEGGWIFTGDATSKARKTAATSTDYILICNDKRLKSQGLRVIIGDSNPAISDRVAATNRQFKNADDERKLFIAPHCKKLITDVRMRADFKSVGDIGHMTDSLGYLVWTLFPLRIEAASKLRVLIRTPKVSGKA